MDKRAPASTYDRLAAALEPCLESFVTELVALGYSPSMVLHKRATASSFVRWTIRRRFDISTIDESTVETFLAESGRRPHPSRVRRYALAAFLEHLRTEGVCRHPERVPPDSGPALLLERYESYLRVERGLTESTVVSYRPFVSAFVDRQFRASVARHPAPVPSAQDVRDFLLERTRELAPRRAQLLATALRSFLRFLFLRAETPVDLALAVPTVRRWRQAAVHPYLRPEEVERLLDACDPSSAVERRDRAILLLLARLGLRAGEVAALELGDLCWRAGEILVRGKGRILDRLPLLTDIGDALTLYLRQDRPKSSCRRVFLRHDAPRIGLRPGSVGSVVQRALSRAGLRPSRGGAHLLRFSLATTMIRSGASMAQIGEVLRHRSPDTTEIYAKVDFESLRTVALPWTGTGSAQ